MIQMLKNLTGWKLFLFLGLLAIFPGCTQVSENDAIAEPIEPEQLSDSPIETQTNETETTLSDPLSDASSTQLASGDRDHAIVAAVCGENNVSANISANISANPEGEIIGACEICPSFTGYSEEPGGEIAQINYGSFTAPNMNEAVVFLDGCEPHVNNWGGSILLRGSDSNWSMVRYEPAVRSGNCLTFSHNGIDSLVCENGYMNQGYLSNWWDQLEFVNNQIKTTRLIAVTSNTGSCRPPLHEMEILETESKDVNNDGLSDLVAVVSEATKPFPTMNPRSCGVNQIYQTQRFIG
jgi:hypothetical protein